MATQVLPTSVPVPVTTTTVRGSATGRARDRDRHAQLREHLGELVDLTTGVLGGQRHPQPRCAHGDGRRSDGRYQQTGAKQCGGDLHGPDVVADKHGNDGRWMGGSGFGRWTQVIDVVRSLARSRVPSVERTTARAASAAAATGAGVAVLKMKVLEVFSAKINRRPRADDVAT